MWGVLPVVLKIIDLPILTFGTYRLWLGLTFYLILLGILRRPLRWSLLRAAWPGGGFFAVDMVLTFGAFRYTSAANATIIGAVSVVFISLGAARWFGEKLDRAAYLLIGLSFVGVAVVALGSGAAGTSSPFGDVLAMVGVLSWTGYWLFSKRARQSLDIGALEYVAIVQIVAAPLVTIAALATGTSLAPPVGAQWFAVLFAAVISGGLGHLAVAWSHGHVEAWLGALITQSMPIVSSAAAWIVLDEQLTPLIMLGGALVIGATAGIAIRERLGAEDADEPSVPAAV